MRNINTRNIKIDTISKTITFEKSVTSAEIRQLISDLHNYNIVIQEAVVKEKPALELSIDETKPSEFKDYSISIDPANPKDPVVFFHNKTDKPLFGFTCTSPCFCSGKCKTGWSANNGSRFPWNLQDR
jgi:hypothetical protein